MIESVQSLVDNAAIMDAVISQACKDRKFWEERLEVLRGRSTVREVVARISTMSPDETMAQLDAIPYPALSEHIEELDKAARWRKSKAQKIVEANYKQFEDGHITFCLATLTGRDTIRGAALFWELLGIHPDEARAAAKPYWLGAAW